MKAQAIVKLLEEQSDIEKAKVLQRFFKTDKGQYGEGDVFWGIPVPQCRKIARQTAATPIKEVAQLLQHPVHEVRMTALLILVNTFSEAKKDLKKQEEIFNFYLSQTNHINNWDLVDLSCPHIVGGFLWQKDCRVLYTMAEENHLWRQRISIVSTLYFVHNKEVKHTFAISNVLLHHQHDLIQKAYGWLLREAGKKDMEQLRYFICQHAKEMPRTALRYAIEKFPEQERKRILIESK